MKMYISEEDEIIFRLKFSEVNGVLKFDSLEYRPVALVYCEDWDNDTNGEEDIIDTSFTGYPLGNGKSVAYIDIELETGDDSLEKRFFFNGLRSISTAYDEDCFDHYTTEDDLHRILEENDFILNKALFLKLY